MGEVVRRVVLCGLAALPLAACSGEPGESDMRKLVETHTKRALDGQGQGGFRGFEGFRKQGCVDTKYRNGVPKPDDKQYDCYYAATFAPQPGATALTVNGKGRFTRSEKGLTFEDLGAQPR
ncbi:hypothetical protein FW320_24515 [Azospirillum sp. Vi22]|uniref:hypothetical protein n=1 Tax=Azospirillum baldaniorum TaxID=1064539 RepID=UPI00157AE4BF|nr:hypothetical protein [Azospirillum baldaniorum]NUB09327.1 hypothetical protein [Azospirillum baldaniorum]